MKRMHGFIFLLVAPLPAQRCAPSPEDAARLAVGAGGVTATEGFRVSGLQIDTVTQRAWMRVVRCNGGDRPAILVPIDAPLGTGTTPSLAPAATSLSHAAPPRENLIRTGQTVLAHYSNAEVRLTVEGVANDAGAPGDVISLTLRRRAGQAADEPEQRIRGIVLADGSVEVQP